MNTDLLCSESSQNEYSVSFVIIFSARFTSLRSLTSVISREQSAVDCINLKYVFVN
ncbi:hypothetical protein C942_00239 [Photobacterium marinum]|uniref:Uncharacterized protein n=1 Tax=Photobacterium marinum TaxID=1056511 RepID=L8JGD2_9GAMM|nr:hypothetical protein C942_00239 [Photobacterium marinum]